MLTQYRESGLPAASTLMLKINSPKEITAKTKSPGVKIYLVTTSFCETNEYATNPKENSDIIIVIHNPTFIIPTTAKK